MYLGLVLGALVVAQFGILNVFANVRLDWLLQNREGALHIDALLRAFLAFATVLHVATARASTLDDIVDALAANDLLEDRHL